MQWLFSEAAWVFVAGVSVLLIADIVNHRRGRPVTLSSAVKWSGVYVGGALGYCWYLYNAVSHEAASLFLTGYTLEKVLAFDNLFVFSLIFAYFKIPKEQQHAALHWGIAGAIVFRLIFVVVGEASMHAIGPRIELFFAMMIIISIYLMINADDENADYHKAWYVKLAKRINPKITTFMIAVVVIEISDVLFAFDSVPAIIAVTKEPLLIYSSMIFAILGLRSMYFVIAALSDILEYMDQTVIVILSFIALKLSLSAVFNFHIEPVTSLIIIISMLFAGIAASLIWGRKQCSQQ